MKNDTDIIALRHSETVDDPLTEIARDGARRMPAAALRTEADALVEQHGKDLLAEGRQQVVRHGYRPERRIQTGIGALDSAMLDTSLPTTPTDPSKNGIIQKRSKNRVAGSVSKRMSLKRKPPR